MLMTWCQGPEAFSSSNARAASPAPLRSFASKKSCYKYQDNVDDIHGIGFTNERL